MTNEQSDTPRKTIEILVGDSFLECRGTEENYASMMNDIARECGYDIHVTYVSGHREFIKTMQEKEFDIVASDIYYAGYGSMFSHDASEEIMAAIDTLSEKPYAIFLHQVIMDLNHVTRRADANVDIGDGYEPLKDCLMAYIARRTQQ